jgi:hypothetical protein
MHFGESDGAHGRRYMGLEAAKSIGFPGGGVGRLR